MGQTFKTAIFGDKSEQLHRQKLLQQQQLQTIKEELLTNERLNLILFDIPPVPREISLKHAWNVNDKSQNIIIKENDEMTCHRFSSYKTTDCIRGKVGYTKGIHLWEIHWSTKQRGTHPIVGVATDKSPLHCQEYCSLLGGDRQSWGWDLARNKLYCTEQSCYINDNINQQFFYPSKTFVAPDKFYVLLDMDKGTLAFLIEQQQEQENKEEKENNDDYNNKNERKKYYTHYQFLGIAFHNLKGKKLFPIVSTVWGHCEITMRYIVGLDFYKPLPLINLCRQVMIRQIIAVIDNTTNNNNNDNNNNKEKLLLTQLEGLYLPRPVTQYLINPLACINYFFQTVVKVN